MKLIVGLGNAGREYENTRHNAGFMAVRWLAKKWDEQSKWSQSKHYALIIKSLGNNAILAQPTTMMNESGRAVRALMDYYEISINDVVAIHDDADLELGQIKTVRKTKTGAGHHGVLSLIQHSGEGFKRIRIGIGRPEQKVRDISNYVLGRLSAEEKNVILQAFEENSLDILAAR